VFVLSQFGVFGPIYFVAMLVLFAAPTRFGGPPARLLTAFAWPALTIIAAISLLSRAQPNWAAPAYVSAVILVVEAALRWGWRRTAIFSIALHLAAAIAVFGGSEVIAGEGLHVPAKFDPLHRLRGWDTLGNAVAAELATHPGLRLMTDDREIVAALIYYVHPHPFNAVIWDPVPGVSSQWDLENNLSRHAGESFLAVTVHNLADQMRPQFGELTEIKTIDIKSGPGGGQTYTRRPETESSRVKPIAAGLGHQDFSIRRIALDFLTQAIDMGFERMRRHPGIVTPHLTEQRRAADRAVASVVEIAQDRGFLFGEPHLFSPRRIGHQLGAGLKRVGADRKDRIVAMLALPQMRA
jgi:hypothetical protein